MQRARPQSAVAHDADLLRGALVDVAERGWDAASIRSMAQRSGLTHGAVYGRVANRGEWGAKVWAGLLRPALDRHLTGVSEAIRRRDAGALRALLHEAAVADVDLRAALELVMAAAFDPGLRDAVRLPAADLVGEYLNGSPADAARHAVAVSLVLGLVLTSTRPWVREAPVSEALGRWSECIVAEASASDIPADRAMHLGVVPEFTTGDDRIDRLLLAVINEVGAHGYARTTIQRICALAGVTSGLAYARFSGKLEIFLAAIQATLAEGFSENTAWLHELTGAHGRATAEAIAIREIMRPDLTVARTLTLEQARLANFEPRLAQIHVSQERSELESRARQVEPDAQRMIVALGHVELALSLGVLIVADLAPEAWRLPYIVVTGPAAHSGLFIT